jgi:hypothetical protein
MKIVIETSADIVENLIELARKDVILNYTLEKLVRLSPSYRQDVLNKLRRPIKGRPNRTVERYEIFADLEIMIQDYRAEVQEASKKKRVSEKDVIQWLVNSNMIGHITRADARKSKSIEDLVVQNSKLDTRDLKKLIKNLQDGLSDYRRSKNPSPKSP